MSYSSEKSLIHKGFGVGLAVVAAAAVSAGCAANAQDGQPNAAALDYGTNSPPPTPTAPGSTTSAPAATSPSSPAATSAAPSASATKSTQAPAPAKSSKPTKSGTKPQTTTAAPAKSTPRLSVSKTSGLSNGDRVTVTGSGFDTTKGIYVAFCVKPAAGQVPSPCGGGADTDGNSGASEWISSNPPPYGKNLAIPYGSGGSFSVSIRVSELIGTVNCRTTPCVIASRADHTRTSDRSQDVLIPISFG